MKKSISISLGAIVHFGGIADNRLANDPGHSAANGTPP